MTRPLRRLGASEQAATRHHLAWATMKVLLRKAKSPLCYAENGQWTADPQQARNFEHVHLAIELYRQERLTGGEVVLSFDDPFCDLILPLRTPG